MHCNLRDVMEGITKKIVWAFIKQQKNGYYTFSTILNQS